MGFKGSQSSKPKQKHRKGLWSPEEDDKLRRYITQHGHGCWSSVPINAGLHRNGKSCRLRWINYLRPGLKRGIFTPAEEETVMALHASLGNKWSQIAQHLPGRSDNEIKNHWHSHLQKRIVVKMTTNSCFMRDSPTPSSSLSSSSLKASSNEVKSYQSPSSYYSSTTSLSMMMTNYPYSSITSHPADCDQGMIKELMDKNPTDYSANGKVAADPIMLESQEEIKHSLLLPLAEQQMPSSSSTKKSFLPKLVFAEWLSMDNNNNNNNDVVADDGTWDQQNPATIQSSLVKPMNDFDYNYDYDYDYNNQANNYVEEMMMMMMTFTNPQEGADLSSVQQQQQQKKNVTTFNDYGSSTSSTDDSNIVTSQSCNVIIDHHRNGLGNDNGAVVSLDDIDIFRCMDGGDQDSNSWMEIGGTSSVQAAAQLRNDTLAVNGFDEDDEFLFMTANTAVEEEIICCYY